MKRILLIGNSPLPNENTRVRPAAGLRTWQFLKALEKRCVLKVVTIAMPECYGESVPWNGNVISKNDPDLQEKLQTIHDAFQP